MDSAMQRLENLKSKTTNTMKNITQDFTTPAFADTLKEYGIEIDAAFESFLLQGDDDPENYTIGLLDVPNGRYIDIHGNSHCASDVVNIRPAYPLTQVLRWLPETIKVGNYTYAFHYDHIEMMVAYLNPSSPCEVYSEVYLPIERMVIKGLREGWLTKDMILKNTAL